MSEFQELENVTPTEDLILEVLAARQRLGESLWTFDSRHKHSLERLRRRGLIRLTHGIVERTLRAWLTDAGIERCFDDRYETPLAEAWNQGFNRAATSLTSAVAGGEHLALNPYLRSQR